MKKFLVSIFLLIFMFTNLSTSFLYAQSFTGQDSEVSEGEEDYQIIDLSSISDQIHIDPLKRVLNEIKKYDDPASDASKERYLVKLKQNYIQQSNESDDIEDRIVADNIINGVLQSTSNDEIAGQGPSAFEAITLDLNSRQVNHIINNGLVESIEIDRPISIAQDNKNTIINQELRESSQTTPWGVHSTGAYLVNSIKTGGENVKVAVFDTGISAHPDLNIAGGLSVVEGTYGFQDDHGHGTHIAGTIAAINDSKGIVGFSNNIELYAIKVLVERSLINASLN